MKAQNIKTKGIVNVHSFRPGIIRIIKNGKQLDVHEKEYTLIYSLEIVDKSIDPDYQED